MSTRTFLDGDPLARSYRHLLSACRRVSFWSAVVLPFVSLSLLLSGLDTPTETAVFLVVVLASVLSLVGGRTYAR